MTLESEVASAGIAIATGLAVALLVEAVVAIRMWIRRRASVARIRDFLLEFEGGSQPYREPTTVQFRGN